MRTMTNVGAGLLAAALALYPLVLVPDVHPLIFLAGLALMSFALALLSGDWILAGPGMGMLLGEYAIALRTGSIEVDELVPALAVAALVLMELIDLSRLLARHPAPEKEVIKQRVAHIVAASLMTGAVCTAVLLAARAVRGGPAEFIALAAAAGLIALVFAGFMARRAVEGPTVRNTRA